MKFKSIYLGSILVAAVGFTACTDPQATTDTETDAMLVNTSPASPGASSAQSASVITPAAGKQDQTPATQGSTQAAKTSAAVNPPHGQPGHRCDIAVGAPLDAPAGSGSMPVNVQQGPAPASMTIPASTPNSTTINPDGSSTVKLNPPHGQPGHDCAKPVGAPL